MRFVSINVTALQQIYLQIWRLSQARNLVPSLFPRALALGCWPVLVGIERFFGRNERNVE